MILLCGIPTEAPLQLVQAEAERSGVPCVVFNQREAQHWDIHLQVENGAVRGSLRSGGSEWPLQAFSGVYVRLMDVRDLPESETRRRIPVDPAALRKSQLLHATLSDWLEVADCRVMNRHRAMQSNMSKPYQAQLIRRAGFLIPPTLITNDPHEVRALLRLHRRIVYKSVSSVRSVVHVLDGPKLAELPKVRNLPTQFQRFVPGTNVRVHVAGQEVFATEIRTTATDYRYAGDEGLEVEMAPVTLPPEIAARCISLSHALDLPLCGIDLKRTPDGAYYCFEANPSPAYSYYQQHTGQDIAGAIVRYLGATAERHSDATAGVQTMGWGDAGTDPRELVRNQRDGPLP
jgi:glutathione synthase/RimK-type ligase-like ATP-grasp enzyme